MKLHVIKLNGKRFIVSGGYIVFNREWSIVNDKGGFVTFGGETPYTPKGGRKDCIIAAEGDHKSFNYVKPMNFK